MNVTKSVTTARRRVTPRSAPAVRSAREVYNWFRKQTRDHETAADLTAETFARCLQRYGRDEAAGGERTAMAWIFAIAHNVLRQHRRSARSETRCSQVQVSLVACGSTSNHFYLVKNPANAWAPVGDCVIAATIQACSYPYKLAIDTRTPTNPTLARG